MGATAMDTALGIYARSLQASPASGTTSNAASTKSSDVFASLFSQYAGSQAFQAGHLARSTQLPTLTTQTVPADPRPAPDYSSRADSPADQSAASNDDAPPAKVSHDDDSARTPTNRPAKPASHARSPSKAGNADREDKAAKAGKDEKAGKAGKADKANDDASTAKDATAPDDTSAADSSDAGQTINDQTATDSTVPEQGDAADPILAVMPMAAQPLLAVKQAQATEGAGLKGPGGAAKGLQGPAGKAGPHDKGVNADQAGKAGAALTAGDVFAGALDDTANSTAADAQDPMTALAESTAGLAGSTASGAQAKLGLGRAPGEATPQTAATQLVQAVAATEAGDAGSGANGGLAGERGSGGSPSGAGTRVPDGSQMAGTIDSARPTSGSDFAGTLASVRSARPGMAAGATDQVAIQLQHSAKDGNGSITMQLRPEELGRIDIKLDIDQQGLVSATITADRPQTLELLQRDQRSLEKALQDAGLQTDSGSLNFNLRGEGGQGSNQSDTQGDGNRSARNGHHTAQGESAAPADQKVVIRRYQVAPGRIDVRI